MKEVDWTFKLLKRLGSQFGFLGIAWDANPEGIITKIRFSNPEELERPAIGLRSLRKD